jgi:predicted MPP superfamily phosphohydrolase
MTVRADERPFVRDRRLTRTRRTLELAFDELFRPGNWAAAASYRLGLQGRVRVSTTVVHARQSVDTATDGPTPIATDRPPLRIAFASDFHAGPTTSRRTLEMACEALAALEPHVLLLGGDFISVRADDVNRLVPLLEAIPAPLGKFAVLGNHDLRANHPAIVDHLEHAGVTMLTNAWSTLTAPFDDVTICGLDDALRGDPRADEAMDSAPAGGTRIVLMHAPGCLHAIGDRPFDLAVCGHTHGGQIALPWGKAIVVPEGRLNRRYQAGTYALSPDGVRRLLVSRGVGCSLLPVRLFAGPEVHLCLIA